MIDPAATPDAARRAPPAATDVLRIERCGGCGARYNVTRLAAGSRFTCRRCGAPVVVEAGTPRAMEPRPARGALIVAGLVALLATALRVLPGAYASGAEASVAASIASLALPDAAALALLSVAGGLALVAAARHGSRPVLVALAVVTVALAARAHGPATPVLRTTAPDLAGAVALALLGGAALVLGSTRTETRHAARPWAYLGGLVLVAAAATRFAAGSEGTTSLLVRRGDAARALLTAVWQGTPVPDGLPVAYGVVPDLATALAAALVLVVVLWPGRRGGALARVAGRAAFALLVGAHLAGPAVTVWEGRGTWLAESGPAFVATQVGAACFEGGLALFALGAATLAGLAQPRGGAPRGAAGTGGWLALASFAALGTAVVFADPTGPAPAVFERVRDTVGGLASDGPTAPAVAVTLLVALGIASALAAVVRPLRGRGAFVGGVAAAAACAVDLATSVAGTPRMVIATLVATAAGATWARRGSRWDGRGRAVTAAMAAALLLLLAFPARTEGEAVGLLRYPSALTSWVDALAGATSADVASIAADPTLATVGLALGAALLAALAAGLGPRPVIAWALVAAAGAVALHAPAAAFFTALAEARGATDGPPLPDAFRVAAAALKEVPTAAIVAGIACAADATGGRPRPI